MRSGTQPPNLVTQKRLRQTEVKVDIGTGTWDIDGITLNAAAGPLNLASGVLTTSSTTQPVLMQSNTISIAAAIGKSCLLTFMKIELWFRRVPDNIQIAFKTCTFRENSRQNPMACANPNIFRIHSR